MPHRACNHCGTEYLAKRTASKFCSDRCRKRAQRAPAPVVPLKPARKRVAKKAASPEPELEESTAAVVRAELKKHDRLMTPAGMASIRLAERLDSAAETGSAIAALAKQLTASMELALAGVKVVNDPLDELAGRRAKRAGA